MKVTGSDFAQLLTITRGGLLSIWREVTLAPVGFSLTDDGAQVRLFPLPCAEAAVRTVSDEKGMEEVGTPSVEQLEILAIVAYFGQAPRALIERFRGEDSTSLLERRKALGAPNVYRVTAKALRAAGFPTVEAMRGAVAQGVTAEQQMRLLDAMPATGDDRELMVDTGS